MCTLSAITIDPELKKYFNRKVEEGKIKSRRFEQFFLEFIVKLYT
jgi:hypothetical protein